MIFKPKKQQKNIIFIIVKVTKLNYMCMVFY